MQKKPKSSRTSIAEDFPAPDIPVITITLDDICSTTAHSDCIEKENMSESWIIELYTFFLNDSSSSSLRRAIALLCYLSLFLIDY